MKLAAIVLGILILAVALVELGLRWFLGFGRPTLYIADEAIGYLLAPSQQTKRFGNRIHINEFSMRSPAISPTSKPSNLRVLLIGDSIANGGWWTDDEDTIAERVERRLAADLAASPFETAELLNASASSWGPRNELAYAQTFGLFEANVVVLLINTDDLFATAPTSVQVGADRNYPDRYPPLALAELVERYLPEPEVPGLKEAKSEGGDRVGKNLEAIAQLRDLARQADAGFVLAMTPLFREAVEPGPRDYELVARERLQQFATERDITYIDFLPLFKAQERSQDLFRDNIHLSLEGNELVSTAIAEAIQKFNGQTTGE